MARGVVLRVPPYGASASLIGWLAGEAWLAAAGEYALYNGGAWLGDVPTERLIEIAYFLLRRDLLTNVVEKPLADARQKALTRLDVQLEDADPDEDTGLPAWIVSGGFSPADGSTPFT